MIKFDRFVIPFNMTAPFSLTYSDLKEGHRMTPMGYFFFALSVIAAALMPSIYIDAIKKVKDGHSTLLNKIILGICGGVIAWTVLMMIRPT